MPAEIAAHIIRDGQHKTGSQLSQGSAGAGEGGGVGEELLAGEQVIIFDGARLRYRRSIPLPPWRHDRPPARTSPPRFRRLAVIAAADVTADQHLAGVIG